MFEVMYTILPCFTDIKMFDTYNEAREFAEELRDKGIKKPIGYDPVRKIAIFSNGGHTVEYIKGEGQSW